MSNLLAITSLFFLTNSICAFLTNQYIYAAISTGLAISSFTYHCVYSDVSKIVDAFFVYSFVLFGIYTLYNKAIIQNYYKISSVVVLFGFSIIVYYFGKQYDCFCFDSDPLTSGFFHGLLHILSSFCHNLIILFEYF
jgi:hypothetical protein